MDLQCLYLPAWQQLYVILQGPESACMHVQATAVSVKGSLQQQHQLLLTDQAHDSPSEALCCSVVPSHELQDVFLG